MERTDWLDGGFDSAESRFLMLTAITHHRFNSAVWGALAGLSQLRRRVAVGQLLRPGSPLTGAGSRSTQAAVSGWSRTHRAI